MLMFNKLSVLSVPVKSQQAAKDFYVNVLGCKVITDVPFGPDTETHWVQLELPNTGTSLTLVTWFKQMPPGSLQGVVLTTDDIAATRAELIKRGLAVSEIENQSYALEATFSDPDGNGWVLEQMHPAPAQ